MNEKEVVICYKVLGINNKLLAEFPTTLNQHYGGDWALKYIDKRNWTYKSLKPTSKQINFRYKLTPYQISVDAFHKAQEHLGTHYKSYQEFEDMLKLIPGHHYHQETLVFNPEKDVKSKFSKNRLGRLKRVAWGGKELSSEYAEYYFCYFKKPILTALDAAGVFTNFKNTLKIMFEEESDFQSIQESITELKNMALKQLSKTRKGGC